MNRLDQGVATHDRSLFRVLFGLQALLLLLNPRLLLHLQGNAGNIVQKALIILSGAAFMATRPVERRVVVLIGAIVAVTFICALGTDFPGFHWRFYVGGAVSIVAPFVLLAAEPNERDRLFVLRVLAWLPLLMTLLGVMYQVAGIAPLYEHDPSVGTRLSGTQGIPAWLAAACFTGAFTALELAERRHLGYLVLLVANLVIAVLAGGRMALAMALLICGFDYLRSFRRIPLTKFFAPIWVLLSAGLIFAVYARDFLQHFTSTSLSNREFVWAALRRQLHAHPWFGVGLGNQQALVSEGLTGKTGTIAGHNEYLRIGVELGYPGAIIVFALTAAIFLVVWNSRWVRRDPMFLVCVAAFYIYTLTDNTLSVPQIYFILTAASFACQRSYSTGMVPAPLDTVSAVRLRTPGAPGARKAADLSGPG